MECIGHGWGFQAEPSADIRSRFYPSTVDILDLVELVEADTCCSPTASQRPAQAPQR
jgi:hypothetical protein